MAHKRKTAKEKMLTPDQPEIISVTQGSGPGTKDAVDGKMLISTPREIDSVIRHIKRGKTMTADVLRKKLAEAHGVSTSCPLTTGIFVNIVAAAAEEDREAGKDAITPYWRLLKKDGELNEKYPGGLEHHRKLLESEGIKVVQRGKRMFAEI